MPWGGGGLRGDPSATWRFTVVRVSRTRTAARDVNTLGTVTGSDHRVPDDTTMPMSRTPQSLPGPPSIRCRARHRPARRRCRGGRGGDEVCPGPGGQRPVRDAGRRRGRTTVGRCPRRRAAGVTTGTSSSAVPRRLTVWLPSGGDLGFRDDERSDWAQDADAQYAGRGWPVMPSLSKESDERRYRDDVGFDQFG